MPSRYSPHATDSAIQAHSTDSNVNSIGLPGLSATSMLPRNFSAAASSRKPMTTLTLLSQPPLRGSFFSRLGNRAMTKNGAANVAE